MVRPFWRPRALIAESCGVVKDGWNGFNVLHTAAARVGGLDLGLVPGSGGRDVAGILDGAAKGEIEVVYLLGADEIDTAKLGQAFVIYQGHHGDRGAHRADVILPGAAYTEKDGFYVNTEGRVQEAFRAVFPPGEAREDWTILRALSESLGKTLAFDNLSQLRARLRWKPRRPSPSRGQDPAGHLGRLRNRGAGGGNALRDPDQELLHDRPHQPGLAHHGALHRGIRPRRRQEDGDERLMTLG